MQIKVLCDISDANIIVILELNIKQPYGQNYSLTYFIHGQASSQIFLPWDIIPRQYYYNS